MRKYAMPDTFAYQDPPRSPFIPISPPQAEIHKYLPIQTSIRRHPLAFEKKLSRLDAQSYKGINSVVGFY